MRILLIAYDFPPTRTPRALRWRYLVRELALLGHEVHVLTPDLGRLDTALFGGPGSVRLHRTWPGPFGWLARRARCRASAAAGSPAAWSGGTARLNWRGRLVDALKKAFGFVLFPDVRVEWLLWARPGLRALLRDVPPDIVICSHEPAVSLTLGLYVGRLGIPWVADLGDPVCAPYTASRWRRRALRLEASVCGEAAAVIVTTEATGRLLQSRHPRGCPRWHVITNGYDDRRAPSAKVMGVTFEQSRLELVHAGRLYDYRDPCALLGAVAQVSSTRLTLVLPDPPSHRIVERIASSGSGVRVLGSMAHDETLRLLEHADVLVNFGHTGESPQIPAKVYEYLGVTRPILHVGAGQADVVAQLLAGLDRGWICANDQGLLVGLLDNLVRRKASGLLTEGLQLHPLAGYAHSALGHRLDEILRGCVTRSQQAS